VVYEASKVVMLGRFYGLLTKWTIREYWGQVVHLLVGHYFLAVRGVIKTPFKRCIAGAPEGGYYRLKGYYCKT